MRMMTVLGNAKLSRKIGIFNLPPILTCPNHRDCWRACFAMKAWRQYPNVREKWSENWRLSKTAQFVDCIHKEIKYLGIEMYRINGSGDLYSDQYFENWIEIIQSLPEVKFYNYTKVTKYMIVRDRLKSMKLWPKNFNLIGSFVDGHLNFGGREYCAHLVQEHGAYLCPATGGHKDKVVCGEDCTYCLKGERPVFIQH